MEPFQAQSAQGGPCVLSKSGALRPSVASELLFNHKEECVDIEFTSAGCWFSSGLLAKTFKTPLTAGIFLLAKDHGT